MYSITKVSKQSRSFSASVFIILPILLPLDGVEEQVVCNEPTTYVCDVIHPRSRSTENGSL